MYIFMCASSVCLYLVLVFLSGVYVWDDSLSLIASDQYLELEEEVTVGVSLALDD